AGDALSVTASHELLEMLADPGMNMCCYGPEPNVLYAIEVCDPVEDGNYCYRQGGLLVSNFCYPEWFQDFEHGPDALFDHQSLCRHPFELLPGGYIGTNDLGQNSGWTQKRARKVGEPLVHTMERYQDRPRVGSRRERRNLHRQQWMESMDR